jgi:hypothetical protein
LHVALHEFVQGEALIPVNAVLAGDTSVIFLSISQIVDVLISRQPVVLIRTGAASTPGFCIRSFPV